MIDTKLMGLIPQEGLVLILGGIRNGKSCLGYGLLEELSLERSKPPYVFGLPMEKVHLIPDTITALYSLDLPERSIILFDEAYLNFYARDSQRARNKFMDMLSGLAGQKEILAIYVTQQSRRLDIGLVAGSQVVLIKLPSLLQMKLDRKELRTLLNEAYQEFQKLQPESEDLEVYQKKCTYVLADRFCGMLENSNLPPAFWSEELSKAYANVPLLMYNEVGGGGQMTVKPKFAKMPEYKEPKGIYTDSGKPGFFPVHGMGSPGKDWELVKTYDFKNRITYIYRNKETGEEKAIDILR